MIPTPRTNEISFEFLKDDYSDDLEYYCKMRDHAETLERELHIANLELSSLNAIIQSQRTTKMKTICHVLSNNIPIQSVLITAALILGCLFLLCLAGSSGDFSIAWRVFKECF